MKFTFVTAVTVKVPGGRIIYHYVAVDTHGRLWWFETGQQDGATWQPLPAHPERKAP